MKRIKKNHIIITALAIMIAAAGYINYAGDLNNIIKIKDKESSAVSSDNVTTDNNLADEDTDFTDEPGTVILTSAGIKSEAVAAARLNREQIRASSLENLQSIVNDTNMTEDAKKSAVDELAKLEDSADKETAIELLLSAKLLYLIPMWMLLLMYQSFQIQIKLRLKILLKEKLVLLRIR